MTKRGSTRPAPELAITDRVTILRGGRVVADDFETSTQTQSDIIRHMVDRDIGANCGARKTCGVASAEIALEVRNLRAPLWVRDMSFSVRRGEILGPGGLVGAETPSSAARSEASSSWRCSPRG